MTAVEFRGDLWLQITRVPGLSCGVVCVILHLAVLVEHRLVMDGRMNTGPWLVLRMHSIRRKTNLDFTEARDSEWQWNPTGHMQVCTSLQTDNYASTPPLSFLQAGYLFLPPNQQCQSTEGNSHVTTNQQNFPKGVIYRAKLGVSSETTDST